MDPQVFYSPGLEVAQHCPSSAWISCKTAKTKRVRGPLGATIRC
jgi:hypothetical protein